MQGVLLYNLAIWRGDRADECDGLENRWAFRGPEGSNPSPSATWLPRERGLSRGTTRVGALQYSAQLMQRDGVFRLGFMKGT
jgi:hypothetical protein